jgi:hypothetical protein
VHDARGAARVAVHTIDGAAPRVDRLSHDFSAQRTTSAMPRVPAWTTGRLKLGR